MYCSWIGAQVENERYKLQAQFWAEWDSAKKKSINSLRYDFKLTNDTELC